MKILKKWMTIPAVLIVGAALTLGLPALTAVGQSSTPTSAVYIKSSNVQVFKRGLAASVPIRYVCPAGTFPFNNNANGSSTLSAISHKMVVAANVSFPVTCNGMFHTITLVYDIEGEPFQPGPALVQVTISVCGFQGCSTISNAKAVQLVFS